MGTVNKKFKKGGVGRHKEKGNNIGFFNKSGVMRKTDRGRHFSG